MKFSAYRCKKGAEAAKRNMDASTNPTDIAKWKRTYEMWMSRWREA